MNHQTKHIFILIPGSTDPVCTCPGEDKCTQHQCSGGNVSHEYPRFLDGLKRLCRERPGLELFDTYHWYGANTRMNRETAGAKLANTLCGNHYQSLCAKYVKERVAFHLIGYSHGGNVLNEFTRWAACADTWPPHWEIKSILYLSTPFFKRQHQLDTTRLSHDCAIINVTNDFDLTQRLVADFSILDLISALKHMNQKKPGLKEHLRYVKHSPLPERWAEIKAAFSDMSMYQCLFSPEKFRLSQTGGAEIFQEALNVLQHVESAVLELKLIIKNMHLHVYYPADPEQQTDPQEKQFIINHQQYEQTCDLANQALRHIIRIKKAILASHEKQDYRLLPLIRDIRDSVRQLIHLLTIDPQTASGPLANLLYAIFTNQSEFFDNSHTTPRHQLDFEFIERLHHVDVTREDPYFSKEHLIRFNQLKRQLSQAEADYEQQPGQRNLLRLLICLMASQREITPLKQGLRQITEMLAHTIGPGRHHLKRILVSTLTCRGYVKPLRQLAVQLLPVLQTWLRLIESCTIRLDNPLEKNGTERPEQPSPGSLHYFTVCAHAVSRRQLWPEIEQLLIPLLPAPVFRKEPEAGSNALTEDMV